MTAAPPPLETDALEARYRSYFDDPWLPDVEPASSAPLVAAAVHDAAPALRATLLRRYAELVKDQRTPGELKMFMQNFVHGLARGGLATVFERVDAYLMANAYGAFVAEVNRRDGARRVLFLAHKPYFGILREALHLRRNGHRTYLVSLGTLMDDARSVFDAAFDAVVDAFGSRRFLARLMAALDPDIVHVQCMMWHYALGRLAIEAARCPVVCEFYDITSLFAEREDLCSLWPVDTVDLDLALEGVIARRADAVVHRYTDEAITAWARRAGASPRTLQMLPYPSPEFAAPAAASEPAPGAGIRLVYAGNLIPRNDDHPPRLFCFHHQLEAIEALLDQGFAVDFFRDPTIPMASIPGFADYVDLARRRPAFRLLPGVLPDRLSERLAGYDFATVLTILDPGYRCTPWHLRHTIPTKINTYLEAGLPVVVNAEFAALAAFVEANGIGLAVHSSEIGSLHERLRTFDRAEAAARVRRFGDEHGMHREIHRLIALYEDIEAGAGGGA